MYSHMGHQKNINKGIRFSDYICFIRSYRERSGCGGDAVVLIFRISSFLNTSIQDMLNQYTSFHLHNKNFPRCKFVCWAVFLPDWGDTWEWGIWKPLEKSMRKKNVVFCMILFFILLSFHWMSPNTIQRNPKVHRDPITFILNYCCELDCLTSVEKLPGTSGFLYLHLHLTGKP